MLRCYAVASFTVALRQNVTGQVSCERTTHHMVFPTRGKASVKSLQRSELGPLVTLPCACRGGDCIFECFPTWTVQGLNL